jgi:RHS repeat-associated protein
MGKNASGTTQAVYMNQGPSIYSPLIYMDRSGTRSYHLFNHLGTTLALASAAQALTDTYRWNAWGVQLASTGSTTNPFGYVGALGYYDDPYLSSVHVHARRLTPQLARWRTRDPLSYSFPSSTYVNNHPASLLDPTGLRSSCAHCEGLRQQIRELVTRIESRAPGIHRYAYAGNNPVNVTDPSGEIAWYVVGGALGLWALYRCRKALQRLNEEAERISKHAKTPQQAMCWLQMT